MALRPLRAAAALALAAGCAAGEPAVRHGLPDEVPADTAAGGDTAPGAGPEWPGELRGAWVTRWTPDDEADLRALVDELANAGFNAVFLQVRGTFDALYEPGLEPWSAVLSGTLGADPGWDPLAAAVDEAHARGIQLHAWMNAFPLWSGTEPPPSTEPEHAWNEHPEWRVAGEDGEPWELRDGYVFASPSNPEVRERIAAVAADVAARYAVDGIHLDYIRYPSPDTSHDAVSEARYAAEGGGTSWEDWQRAQVVEAVALVRDALPDEVAVTAAVWGIYRDEWGWSGVSEGYTDYYQDSRAFLSSGAADAIVPMIYWPVAEVEGDRLDFRTLVRDHVEHAEAGRVFAGLGNGLSTEEVVRCIEVAREERADGFVLFDAGTYRGVLHELAPTVSGG